MCSTCLDSALDAANSGGFKIDDDDYETVESAFDEELDYSQIGWVNTDDTKYDEPEYKW